MSRSYETIKNTSAKSGDRVSKSVYSVRLAEVQYVADEICSQGDCSCPRLNVYLFLASQRDIWPHNWRTIFS